MIKAIFYKERIKTQWYLLLALIVSTGFALYADMRVARAAAMNGIGHLWEVMLQRDAIFIDSLQYVPLILGIGLAIVQFAPEMHHKCLKLTLHLPIRAYRAIGWMLGYGVAAIIVMFLPAVAILCVYLQQVMAPELWHRIILTAMPWYLAGAAAYLLTAWICLEPTWKMRIVDTLIAVLVIKVYFLAPAPEAYNSILPWLTIVTLLFALLPMLSVTRFRDGRQD